MSPIPAIRQLRFGVVCQNTTLRAWEAQCVQEILKLEDTRLEVIITDPAVGSESEENALSGKLIRFFGRYFVKPAAFQKISSNDFTAEAEILRCKPADTEGSSVRFEQHDLDLIRKLSLDFLVSFGCCKIHEELAALPKFGVWFFHHDRDEASVLATPFFKEIKEDEDVIEVRLLSVCDGSGESSILKQGWFKNVKESYSDTLDRIYFEAARWPAYVCVQLQRDGGAVIPDDGESTDSPAIAPTDSRSVLICLAVMFKNLLLDKYVSLFRHDQWNVGIVHAPIHRFLETGSKPAVQWIPLREKNVFRADPFGIQDEEKLTILCEEFDYRSPKGYIVWTESSADATPISSGTLFRQGFHMSYPYLFQHGGHVYCVPETGDTGRTEILRAIDFPREWTRVGEIGEGLCGVDTTVFQHEGTWWAACTRKDRDENLNLFLYYTEELDEPWMPHTRNPVKTDVRSARPAGTPFVHAGNLYRPAQDSSALYGGRVVINRVNTLNPNEFDEEIAAVVEPYSDGPYPLALHTLSSVGDLTVIDSMRHTFVRSMFKKIFFGRVKKTAAMIRNLFFHKHNG